MPEGSGFGELALLYNSKRTATIRADTEEVETYVLDGKIFKTIIVKSSIDKRSVQNSMLNKIKLFDPLDQQQKNRLAEGLKEVYLKDNDFVFKEGEEGESFYVIEQGSVDCLKLHEKPEGACFVKVRTLSEGDHFGEIALINKQVRSLSIRVSSANGCKLLMLDKETFTRILGSIEKFLNKDYDKKFDNKF